MDFTTDRNESSHDDDTSPASLPTTLPAPPRMPTFVPTSARMAVPRRGLVLVASNDNPDQMRATVPAFPPLRLVSLAMESSPPPSIPPMGSTPIRRAA